jgi:hypothetical protein
VATNHENVTHDRAGIDSGASLSHRVMVSRSCVAIVGKNAIDVKSMRNPKIFPCNHRSCESDFQIAQTRRSQFRLIHRFELGRFHQSQYFIVYPDGIAAFFSLRRIVGGNRVNNNRHLSLRVNPARKIAIQTHTVK